MKQKCKKQIQFSIPYVAFAYLSTHLTLGLSTTWLSLVIGSNEFGEQS